MDGTSSHSTGLGPVVVGTDGSDEGTRAVLWAAAEAAAREQPLAIVHGAGPEPLAYYRTPEGVRTLFDDGRIVLDDAAAAVTEHHPDLQVSTTLSRGAPAESLLEATGPADTLVVGSRGHGGFASLLVGSVGLRVAARAPGPVVVVRETIEPPAGTVVAAVRDDGDLHALRFAARTAALHGAALHVVSVWMFLENAGSMVALVGDVGDVARAELDATRRTVEPVRQEFPGVTITEDVLRSRSVAGSLVDASAHADLLVMGARRRAHAFGSGLGRVTHAVLHHAHYPVAILPRL
jgi:nucleotide-binding universal stress UspA family protein